MLSLTASSGLPAASRGLTCMAFVADEAGQQGQTISRGVLHPCSLRLGGIPSARPRASSASLQ